MAASIPRRGTGTQARAGSASPGGRQREAAGQPWGADRPVRSIPLPGASSIRDRGRPRLDAHKLGLHRRAGPIQDRA